MSGRDGRNVTGGMDMRALLFAPTALLSDFRSDCEGTTSIEYAFIAAGIAMAIVVTVGVVGTELNDTYLNISSIF